MEFILPLFILVIAAAFGGILAKSLKFPPFVGYVLAGLVFGTILPAGIKNVAKLSEIGTVLLLFSIGIELSLTKLSRFFKIAVFGALIQVVLVSALLYFLLTLFGFSLIASLILASGFSLSSTAIIVKILGDGGELDTIHGGIMLGWLLIQDLAVIPMMIVLPVLALGAEYGLLSVLFLSLIKALLVIFAAVLIGRTIVPFLIHKVASSNSRELLTLSSVALALGTATGTYFLGVSPALGAFLAGVVISESQEHHAIFAETRPLRDLFVSLFFVGLGFLINPTFLFTNLGIVLILVVIILTSKILVVFLISSFFGYKGRTAVVTALGLSQVGEFAFIIFGTALTLGLINQSESSIGVATGLLTIIATPILFRSATPIWRKLKRLSPVFSIGEKKYFDDEILKNHIVICGYGRVGSWIGRALTDFKIPFVVIEYNRDIVNRLKEKGTPVIYGDPGEPEVLELANIKDAKALVLAIPDRVVQENLIAYVETLSPSIKIISRVHEDSDWEKLKALRVDKIVQPEFEAAIAITKGILVSMGKSKNEILQAVRSLRISHSK